jgi:RNA-directed DNA polymerase
MAVGRVVKRLQERIFKAMQDGYEHRAKELMKLLARSESAKLLAVYKATQQNKGKVTPGIDGRTYLKPGDREALSREPFDYHTWQFQPALRKYIPKGKGILPRRAMTPAEMRPLSIMTIKDRVMATIISFAMEAMWEAVLEPNVMGYRAGRCTQDAIQVIFKALSKGNPAILDADIKSFFDNIKHETILERITCFRAIIGRALTAGIVEDGRFTRITRGIMQGSPLSPVLANIALHGMERELEATPGVVVVRYADDLVGIAPTKRMMEAKVVPALVQYLTPRGLSLKAEKTRIVTKKEGFDFLGFTIKQPRLKLSVKPRKKNVHGFLEHVRGIIRSNKQAEQRVLISLLNPVIDGWARYYQYSDAGRDFVRIDTAIWHALWHWAKRRHPNKNRRWVLRRYFGRVGQKSWCFRVAETGYALKDTSTIKRKKYTFAVGSMSVLDRAWLGRKAGYKRSAEESEHVEYQ